MSDRCAICYCDATHSKLGFRVCAYHVGHGESDPSCPICRHPGTGITLDTPSKIEGFRCLALYHAMRLEAKGLRHSSGKSITALVKREFSIRGNRERVIAQFAQLLRDRKILLSPPPVITWAVVHFAAPGQLVGVVRGGLPQPVAEAIAGTLNVSVPPPEYFVVRAEEAPR